MKTSERIERTILGHLARLARMEGLPRVLAARVKQAGMRGQTLVVVAVMLIALVAMLGLLLDSGMVQAGRRHAQRAADAGAQAGAYELLWGNGTAQINNATLKAQSWASTNGMFTPNVLVEIPPSAASGSSYANSNGFVRVEVARPTSTSFIRLLLSRYIVPVRATATAGLRRQQVDVTLLALQPTGPSAISFSGNNASINVGGGAVVVDSSDPYALNLQNGNITASNVVVVGGTAGADNGSIIGTLFTGAPVTPDPFQLLTAPFIVGATVTYGDGATATTSLDSGGTPSSPNYCSVSGNVTLRPGIYWGGIKFSGLGSAVLSPGRYVMAGGGLDLAGQGSIQGTNVFIYNTNDPSHPVGRGAYGPIDLSGNGIVNLTATPVPDYYGGILIFNDRASTQTITLVGNGSTSTNSLPPITGYVYAKSSLLELKGNGYMGGLGAVVNTVRITGNGAFGPVDAGHLPLTWKVRLVE